jgi:ABC-2 type transport system permease protein
MRPWSRIFFTSARDAWQGKVALLCSGLFLCLILFIYSSLWNVLAQERAWDVSPITLLWYLAITELAVMAPGAVVRSLEADVATGAFSLQRARPCGYFAQRFTEFAGQMLVRFTVLVACGFTAALLYTQALPAQPLVLLAAVGLAFGGSILALVHLLTIGACALWIENATPIGWLWQKLLFVFGGMMIPLQLYPETLRQVASCTPFAVMLYGPGSLLFEPTLERVLIVALQQMFWLVLSVALLCWLSSRATKYSADQGKG